MRAQLLNPAVCQREWLVSRKAFRWLHSKSSGATPGVSALVPRVQEVALEDGDVFGLGFMGFSDTARLESLCDAFDELLSEVIATAEGGYTAGVVGRCRPSR